jgi:NADH-quinone oxidoreductase E subunit
MPYETGVHRSERVLPASGEPFVFTPENRARLETIAARYPPDRRRSGVLPALYLVQQQQGHVTASAMRHVAEVIGITPAEVEDVVSYYVMFHTKPVGTFVLQVCRTLSCALVGAERLVDALAKKLDVQVGETDATGMFTLTEVECLGACDRGPVVMINDHWQECASPDDAARLIDELREKGAAALTGCHLKIER